MQVSPFVPLESVPCDVKDAKCALGISQRVQKSHHRAPGVASRDPALDAQVFAHYVHVGHEAVHSERSGCVRPSRTPLVPTVNPREWFKKRRERFEVVPQTWSAMR